MTNDLSKYRVEVGVTRTATVTVNAETEDEARDAAKERLAGQPLRGEIVDEFTNSVEPVTPRGVGDDS